MKKERGNLGSLIIISLSLFLVLLGLGFISACDDSQTIMRLYSTANAHGALWNQSLYTWRVCYDDLIGKTYISSAPHNCSTTNSVVWLSDIINSHASTVRSTIYNTPVCFGDLSCINRTSCLTGETAIVSLFSNTNAHISLGNDTSYPVKICCNVSALVTPPNLGTFNWLNLNGVNISSADLNDTVLAYFGENATGNSVAYKIVKRVSPSPDTEIVSGTTTAGYVLWKPIVNGDYYFNITLNGITNTSKNLTIRSIVNNAKPNVLISSVLPSNILNINGTLIKVFARNQPIYLNKTVSDEDDLVNLKWYFGVNLFSNFNLYSSFLNKTGGNVVYAPDYPSNYYDITLSAQEQELERKQNVNNSINIYLLEDGINVIPIITSPNQTAAASSNVYFDGSNSIVLNCSSLPCPSCQIQNIAGKNCSYIHAPGIKTTGLDYNLSLSWKIINNSGGVEIITGDWNKNYTSAVQFRKSFNNQEDYLVQLNLKYISNVITENATDFVPFSTIIGWTCTQTSTTAFWEKSGSRVNASNNCTLYKNDIGGDSCCPYNNNVCNNNVCNGQATFCSNLTPQSSCDNPAFEVRKNSFTLDAFNNCSVGWHHYNATCDRLFTCLCEWDSTTKCSANQRTVYNCSGTIIHSHYSCTFNTSVSGDCATANFLTVISTVSFPPGANPLLYPPSCHNDTSTLPCPSTAKLPFASGWSILIAVLVIVLVYLVLRKFHKKHL